MLEVYIPAYGRTLLYPESCIFSDFEREKFSYKDLKMNPQERVEKTKEFIRKYLNSIKFLGQQILLEGPKDISILAYKEHSFPKRSSFYVIVGNGMKTTINNIYKDLREHGPYSDKLNGRCVVIHNSNIDRKNLFTAFNSIKKTYSQLNLGKLELLSNFGNNGFIDVGENYTTAVRKLCNSLKGFKDVIAIVVLPDEKASEMYYRTKGDLFKNQIPVQAVLSKTIKEIVKNKENLCFICVNLASQLYIKLGGAGTAVWILEEPSDKPIDGVPEGSSCYAYIDISRRVDKKSSATAYSAMVDPYGRYITMGTKPIGAEKLTPSTFYEILEDILWEISEYNKTSHKELIRLVFAKDGVIKDNEAKMMGNVIREGVPGKGKESISDLLRKLTFRSLIIDVIAVNKTPNRRILSKIKDKFVNVQEGTAISYNDSKGLLVSCSWERGTIQPIEISIKDRIGINIDEKKIPKPHISQILEEYYRLTILNWASIFKQGKYALPHILTQNLGKYSSAGVDVPGDTIPL